MLAWFKRCWYSHFVVAIGLDCTEAISWSAGSIVLLRYMPSYKRVPATLWAYFVSFGDTNGDMLGGEVYFCVPLSISWENLKVRGEYWRYFLITCWNRCYALGI